MRTRTRATIAPTRSSLPVVSIYLLADAYSTRPRIQNHFARITNAVTDWTSSGKVDSKIVGAVFKLVCVYQSR